jgi:hypothetical protein
MTAATLNKTEPPAPAGIRHCELKQAFQPDSARDSRLPHCLVLTGIVILAALLRLPGISDSFGAGIEGWTGAFYAGMARNCLRMQTLVPSLTPLASANVPVAYVNHPPATPWAVTASFVMLGESETAARFPFWLASVLCVVYVYRLSKRFHSPGAALIAALLMATCPAAVVYGQQVEVVGSLMLLGMLGTALAFEDYFQAKSQLGAVRLAIWIGFLLLTDWPGTVFLAALFCVGYFRWPHARKQLIAFGLCSGACFLALVGWLLLADDGFGLDHFLRKIEQRSFRLSMDDGKAFGLSELLRRYFYLHWVLVGPAMMVLSLIWLVIAAARRFHGDYLLLPFVVFTAAFFVFGAQGHYQHDFWMQPVTATYALMAASAFVALRIRPIAAALGIALMISAANLHDARYYDKYLTPKTDVAADSHYALAELVKERVGADEVVAVVDGTGVWPTLPYYLDRPLLSLTDPGQAESLDGDPEQLANLWSEHISRYEAIWPNLEQSKAPAAGNQANFRRPKWLLTRTLEGLPATHVPDKVHHGWYLIAL